MPFRQSCMPIYNRCTPQWQKCKENQESCTLKRKAEVQYWNSCMLNWNKCMQIRKAQVQKRKGKRDNHQENTGIYKKILVLQKEKTPQNQQLLHYFTPFQNYFKIVLPFLRLKRFYYHPKTHIMILISYLYFL